MRSWCSCSNRSRTIGVAGSSPTGATAGADVTVLDRSLARLAYLDDIYMGRLKTRYSNAGAIAELLTSLDASGVRRLDDVELDR